MSSLHIEIVEQLEQGFNPEYIAQTLDVPVNWVYTVLSSLQYDQDYDDSMDGDHATALASVGWGTDEDYIHENDYFDDY